jgi:hypothetical protein
MNLKRLDQVYHSKQWKTKKKIKFSISDNLHFPEAWSDAQETTES